MIESGSLRPILVVGFRPGFQDLSALVGGYLSGRRDVIGHSYEVNYSVFIAVTLLN